MSEKETYDPSAETQPSVESVSVAPKRGRRDPGETDPDYSPPAHKRIAKRGSAETQQNLPPVSSQPTSAEVDPFADILALDQPSVVTNAAEKGDLINILASADERKRNIAEEAKRAELRERAEANRQEAEKQRTAKVRSMNAAREAGNILAAEKLRKLVADANGDLVHPRQFMTPSIDSRGEVGIKFSSRDCRGEMSLQDLLKVPDVILRAGTPGNHFDKEKKVVDAFFYPRHDQPGDYLVIIKELLLARAQIRPPKERTKEDQKMLEFIAARDNLAKLKKGLTDTKVKNFDDFQQRSDGYFAAQEILQNTMKVLYGVLKDETAKVSSDLKRFSSTETEVGFSLEDVLGTTPEEVNELFDKDRAEMSKDLLIARVERGPVGFVDSATGESVKPENFGDRMKMHHDSFKAGRENALIKSVDDIEYFDRPMSAKSWGRAAMHTVPAALFVGGFAARTLYRRTLEPVKYFVDNLVSKTIRGGIHAYGDSLSKLGFPFSVVGGIFKLIPKEPPKKDPPWKERGGWPWIGRLGGIIPDRNEKKK